MESIRDLMAGDHRQCDECFVAVEQAVAKADWAVADAAFARFRDALDRHLDAEEGILFPAFEARTGMTAGPTQVMRSEHAQMRELVREAGVSLAKRDAEDYSGYAETFLIMTQQHNMKEENILYPMCDQHLSPQADELVLKLKKGIAGSEQ